MTPNSLSILEDHTVVSNLSEKDCFLTSSVYRSTHIHHQPRTSKKVGRVRDGASKAVEARYVGGSV